MMGLHLNKERYGKFLFTAMRDSVPPEILSDRNLTAFRMGASIYVGTFLLGNNKDYRLAFLILVVLQLFAWVGSKYKGYQALAIASICLVMVSCWYFAISSVSFLNFFAASGKVWLVFDEFCNWTLFASLTYLIVASMPDWIKHLLLNWFAKRYMIPSTS